MYIHACFYVYIHIYTYIYAYLCIFIYIFVYIFIYLPICIHSFVSWSMQFLTIAHYRKLLHAMVCNGLR